MYKIVGSPRSRLIRVSWMLEELGEDYEIVKTSPRSADMLKYNPAGKGPVLVDSHRQAEITIIDSAAICSYLADRHSDKDLSAPVGSGKRAAIDSWMYFAQCDLEAPIWLKAKHLFILPQSMRLDVREVTKYEFERAVSAMDARLGDKKFAIGDRFTCADILLGHIGHWARVAKFEINSDRINAYFDRVLARPALARAREKEADLDGSGNL